MPRIALKGGTSEPLPPHEQSLLNTLVFTLLCNREVFSLLNKISEPERHDALYNAIEWCVTHGLVDDEQD